MVLVTFDETKEYWDAGSGVEYYILPNTPQGLAATEHYWEFACEKSTTFELKTNLFYIKNGKWNAFFVDGDEKSFNLTFSFKADDGEPAWNDNSTVTAKITYDQKGVKQDATVGLSELMNSKSVEGNVYSQVKYFLFIDDLDVDSADVELTEIFNCKAGILYTKTFNGAEEGEAIKIPLTADRATGFELYEINGSTLTANRSFTGKVKVVMATIRTKDDEMQTPYQDAINGTPYVLVNMSTAKDLRVESSLSIHNMTPTFSFETGKFFEQRRVEVMRQIL